MAGEVGKVGSSGKPESPQQRPTPALNELKSFKFIDAGTGFDRVGTVQGVNGLVVIREGPPPTVCVEGHDEKTEVRQMTTKEIEDFVDALRRMLRETNENPVFLKGIIERLGAKVDKTKTSWWSSPS